MRTLSSSSAALASCRAGFASHVRVLVQRDATWVDLSTLVGGDYLLGASWSDSIEAPVSTASVSVVRNGPGGTRLSLAPLVVASFFNTSGGAYAPLIRPGVYFRIETAAAPLGTLRSNVPPSSWTEAWRGRIDEVDPGPEEMTFSGRDLGGVLQDTHIEVDRNYGSTAGVAVQSVIQSILNDNGMGSYGLYTPVNPSSVRGPYAQKQEPILDAVRFLAEQIGWDVRMRWRVDAGAFALTLWSPDRTTLTPVASYGPDYYLDASPVRQSLEHVRNVVQVVYSDKADLDATGARKRKTVEVSNAASIALYGRRWMRVAEAASSLIDTAAEALRLANAALADLSESAVSMSLTLPGIHWYLEASDLIEVQPDSVRFDSAQVLAVQSVEFESASSGEARTKLELRGRPSTSLAVWASKESRPGVAPSVPFTGPSAPAGLSVTNTVNGFSLAWTPAATGPAWDSYELHISSSPAFTPSQATFRANSRATRFEVADLVAGRAYYARVIPRDEKGNAGPASTEVTLAPRYVAPSMLLPTVTYAALPLNSDFEALSNASLPPDGWSVSPGVWNVDAFDEPASVFSGARAVRLAPTLLATKLGSTPFVVRPDDLVYPSVLMRGNTEGTDNNYTCVLWLAWLDGNGNLLTSGGISPVDVGAASSLWKDLGRGKYAVAPTLARYCQLYIGKGNALAYTLFIDSARVVVQSKLEGLVSATLIPASGWVWTGAPRGGPSYYRNEGETVLGGSIKNGTLGSACFQLDSGYRPGTEVRFPVVSNGAFGWVKVTTDGYVTPMAGSTTEFSLEGVRFRAAG
ncbi:MULTISPECIES: fibronectin type III domain-containing protein [unclassified Corallococcus]|uniref:fibronectin type III domain-containing protein n=1 Tax=unclassified Corallococcus TaxID=2685029 RepID=UPI001A8F62B4|nr:MULTISPECIES: fibronectin type III domain-containing protein [unclassified Corallococcus]MBN9687117.1 fibronectin type III domain-containing protein [Corallococcus sp. NCSPR001]WAS89055.1 fibronectin type III domain-containing protein [Corallococcus sp. NCRR]